MVYQSGDLPRYLKKTGVQLDVHRLNGTATETKSHGYAQQCDPEEDRVLVTVAKPRHDVDVLLSFLLCPLPLKTFLPGLGFPGRKSVLGGIGMKLPHVRYIMNH